VGEGSSVLESVHLTVSVQGLDPARLCSAEKATGHQQTSPSVGLDQGIYGLCMDGICDMMLLLLYVLHPKSTLTVRMHMLRRGYVI
jgi:hypothetical protein